MLTAFAMPGMAAQDVNAVDVGTEVEVAAGDECARRFEVVGGIDGGVRRYSEGGVHGDFCRRRSPACSAPSYCSASSAADG
jgi:hypothetical protein